MLHNQPIHPLNAIINKACRDYYTGKVLPGYSTDKQNCSYYSREGTNGNAIAKCIIGSIVQDTIAKKLASCEYSIKYLTGDSSYQSRVTVLNELFSLIKASYFIDTNAYTKEENRLEFIRDLQNSHDNFLMNKSQPLLEGSNLALHIWKSMAAKYPHLMTVYFLPSDTMYCLGENEIIQDFGLV